MEDYREPVGISDFAFYVILIVVSILVLCVLANTISNLIERIAPDLRTINPGQAWLSIIPVFGSFWIFYVVQQTSAMVHEEFQRRKIIEFENSPGLVSGWGFSFIFFCAQLTLMIDVPAFTISLYLGAIATLIVFWVKLAGFKTKLDQDLLRKQSQFYQQSYNSAPTNPFPQTPQSFPSPHDFPSPPSPAVADEWEKWKPK